MRDPKTGFVTGTEKNDPNTKNGRRGQERISWCPEISILKETTPVFVHRKITVVEDHDLNTPRAR